MTQEEKQLLVVDFYAIHSKEEIEEVDKRIMDKQKEYDAKLLDANIKASKDFPMTK